ncbi:hypothetical protein pdul_cds_663 [Pandoravirus dulcis]|uniref:Uncharacterized protein n=1 Tax=Pandoravirus dulcis TaxID=1349409 RepID=S4VTR2_9VIRU|nr:hypothetical protein pdul_cds_663 [Pandoravirus dulcis]AGO82810.1 hypothetical protein pdul_cds_663 [Pandoravirus dulcis]
MRGTTRDNCVVAALCAAALSILVAIIIAAGVVPVAEQVHALVSLHRRLRTADCHVTGHVEVADRVREDRPEYLAGLLVDFETDRGVEIVNATALANIEPTRAWLTSADRGRLYDRHPVGSTLRCAYDGDAPRETVAASPQITDYASRVAFGVLSATILSAVALFVAAPMVLFGLYVCGMAVLSACKWARQTCTWPLASCPYLVLGGDGGDDLGAPNGADPVDREL